MAAIPDALRSALRSALCDQASANALATELEKTYGQTAGTAVASEALTLDANKDASGVRAFTQGAFASLVQGSGVPISSSLTSAKNVYSDDAGANIGTSCRGVRSRFLLTVDQSAGTIRSLQGQLKAADGVDFATGVYTAVQGYLELAGTHESSASSTLSCFDASLEVTTALTAASGGFVAGIRIETTGAGTLTSTGTIAGVLINNPASAPDWPYGIYMTGADVMVGIQLGAQANTAGSGVVLASGRTGALKVYTDDAGTTPGTSCRGILSRCLLTVDGDGGTIRAAQGQLKVLDGVDFSTGVYTAVQGYIELAGDTSVESSGNFSCFDASVEIASGKTLTIDSGGVAAGVKIETTGSGSISNSGICAGIAITNPASAPDWPHGIFMTGTDVTVGLQIGEQANTAGSGCVLSSTATGALKVYTDDAGTTPGTSCRGILSRCLLTVDGDGGSIRAIQGQLKLTDGTDVSTGIYTGVQGYIELMGDHSVESGATFSCFDASVEIAAGKTLTVDNGAEFCGYHAETTGTGTLTATGTTAGLLVTNAAGADPFTSAVHLNGCDNAFGFSSATDYEDGIKASVATPAGDTTHAIRVDIGGTPGYIPVYAAESF
jgi:hypothetical protein